MDNEEFQYKLPEVRVKLAEGAALYSNRAINAPEDAVHCMAEMFSSLDREYFCVVNLDTKCHPLNYNIVSIGGINTVPVEMANVFKSAILSNASGVMLIHNHPSGDVTPSQLDIAVTKKVYLASQLMDIKLIDHIIVGGLNGHYYSMLESGWLSEIAETNVLSESLFGEELKGNMASPKAGITDTVEKVEKKTRKRHRSR